MNPANITKALTCAAILFFYQTPTSDQFKIKSSDFGNISGSVSSENHKVNGTSSQSAIGTMTGESYHNLVGLLSNQGRRTAIDARHDFAEVT